MSSATTEPLHVAVVYNQPARDNRGQVWDAVSESAVVTEAEHVAEALRNLGYRVSLAAIGDVITDLPHLAGIRPDLLFNLCEGYRGDAHQEMHLTGMWELLGIPYTGNTPLTLGISQDKVLTKQIFQSRDIDTPAWEVYETRPVSCSLNYPLIAKPSREDASLGISGDALIEGFDDLQRKVIELLDTYREPILVEEYIHGREFNLGVMGSLPGEVLPISEIVFEGERSDSPRITSYEAKWLPDHPLFARTPAVCPAEVSEELGGRLRHSATRVYSALNGRDYGRVDVRLDESGKIYVLEFNPNPDISRDAGFARAVKASGIGYEEFVARVVTWTLKRMAYDQN
jgi:D-alanine-D-alanine ligase